MSARLHAGRCAIHSTGWRSECTCHPGKFEERQELRDVRGHGPGLIDSIFRTQAGEIRFVIESTSPGREGQLAIFDPSDLEAP